MKVKAVVDYIIVPLKCIEYCEYLKVHLTTDLMTKLGAESDKILDHSLLECEIRCAIMGIIKEKV